MYQSIITSILLLLAIIPEAQTFKGAAGYSSMAITRRPQEAHQVYSMRKVNPDYTGNCIKVTYYAPTDSTIVLSTLKEVSAFAGPCMTIRRSSDDATQDIGWSGTYVDTNAIKTFISSSDAHVVTFYNQKFPTYSDYAFRQTTNSLQPRIAIGGVIQYIESYPAIKFDSAGTYLDNDTIAYALNTDRFIGVSYKVDVHRTAYIWSGRSVAYGLRTATDSTSYMTSTQFTPRVVKQLGFDLLHADLMNTAIVSKRSSVESVPRSAFTGLRLGAVGGTAAQFLEGKIIRFVVATAALDSTDIGFSGIFIDTAAIKAIKQFGDIRISTWYDQNDSAFHARQNTLVNMPIIKMNDGVIRYNKNIPAVYFRGEQAMVGVTPIIPAGRPKASSAIFTYDQRTLSQNPYSDVWNTDTTNGYGIHSYNAGTYFFSAGGLGFISPNHNDTVSVAGNQYGNRFVTTTMRTTATAHKVGFATLYKDIKIGDVAKTTFRQYFVGATSEILIWKGFVTRNTSPAYSILPSLGYNK